MKIRKIDSDNHRTDKGVKTGFDSIVWTTNLLCFSLVILLALVIVAVMQGFFSEGLLIEIAKIVLSSNLLNMN